MNRILIVEDDESISSPLIMFLKHNQFECTLLEDALNVVEKVKQLSPNLVVLDRMLPGGDGVEVCQQIREFSDVPVILLTAKSEEKDRLTGLESGADDYVCKPFSAPELILRIKAILKRSEKESEQQANQLIQLDESINSLVAITPHRNKHSVELTPVECALMRLFLNSPNKVVTREIIKASVYKDHRVVSDRTIDSHVSKLRKKVDKLALAASSKNNHVFIHSVYGTGYKYTPKLLLEDN